MTIFTDLISNVALLLALSILYSFLTRVWKHGEITGQIFAGILFGGVAVAGMIHPFNYAPGVIFDGRSMVVSMAGLFGGPVTAAIATLIAGVYRLGLGGIGSLTGFGVIFTSAALGVGYHYFRRKNPDVTKPLYLFAFGVIVHISMLLWMLTLPWPLAFEVLDRISIPVMLVFPLGTLFLGTLLADQEGRNYAQDALRESEERYRTLMDNLPVAVYRNTSGPEGEFLMANPAFCKMLGFKNEEEVKDLTPANLYQNPKERKQYSDNLIEKGVIKNDERTLLKRDGTPVYTSITSRVVYGKDGKISHFDSIMLDITEQKLAEEALRDSGKTLKSIFVAAPIGIGTVSDRVIKQANDRLCEMTGYSKDELIGESVRIVYPTDEEFEHVGREKYALIRDSGTGTVETKFQRKDGKVIDILLSSTPMDPDDLLRGVTFTALDITTRKRIEGELRESEEKYRSMMESMKDAVYICSSDFRVEYMNSAMIQRTGRDAIGKNCFKALHDLDEKCPWCKHDKIKKGESVESDIVSPKDNRSYHISSSPIIHGDGSISKMTVFRDTTDLRILETQLQQAQKMEAIGTLAGGIAHDFNNILGAIIGLSELSILETTEGSSLNRHIEKILEAGMRAKGLVQQILAFSRQRDQERISMSINPVIDEALKFLRSSLPSSIKISHYIKKDLGLIEGDPTQIHQVMMNLCTNAEHSMREKGEVLHVEVERVNVDETMAVLHHNLHPGPYVRLEVKDTGYGIEPATMERIFDPYFTTKGVGEGTGLGLAVVQGIVHKHGGAITVESEVGKGTTFEVFFPVIEGEKKEIEEKRKAPLPTGTEHILFIDDEEVLAEVGKEALEHLGYEVIIRTSSTDALELFKAKPGYFDLVITDMSMPNMTGEQLSREVIKIRPELPIILCTGFSHIISKEKAHEIGIKAFVMKPLVRKDLAETVRKVLDEK